MQPIEHDPLSSAWKAKRLFPTTLPAFCGAILAIVCLLPAAHAQNTTDWDTGTGDFLTSGNWTQGVPGRAALQNGFFYIDNGGTANLSGSREISGGRLGYAANTTGTLNILAGGHLTSIRSEGQFGEFGEVYVGDSGTGTVNVLTGGQMTNYNLLIAGEAGGTGTVTVQGGTITNVNNLLVGVLGTGTLDISSHGTVSNTGISIADQAGSSGTVTLSSGSLTATGELSVGTAGSGTLTVSNQANVSSGSAVVGSVSGATGQVTLDNSTWTNTSDVIVGSIGTGSVLVRNGASLIVEGNATLSNSAGASGSVTVEDGSWSVGNFLTIGQNAAGTVTVNTSGTLTAESIFVSGDSDSAESKLEVNGGTVVAGQIAGLSNGSLAFTNGTLRFSQDNAGYFAGFDDGDVTLDGSAVTFDTRQYHIATEIALEGSASLIKTGGGRLGLSGANTYTGGTYLQKGEILINNSAALGTGALQMGGAELRSTANATLALPQISVDAGQNGIFSTAANTTLALSSGIFSLGEDAFFRVGSDGNTGTVVFNATAATALQPGTGTISVGYGTLRAGNQQLSSLASQVEKVFVVSGATLDFNDQTAGGAVNGLFGEGTVHTGTQSASTLMVRSGDFAGVISGQGSLAKVGSGTLTFSGTYTAVGSIVIEDGTFLNHGNTNDIVVNGGTFGGTGSSDVITLRGGTLAPGGASGTLSAYAMEWTGGVMEYNLAPDSLTGHLTLAADLVGNGDKYLFSFINAGAAIGDTFSLISFQSSLIDIEDFGVANTDGLTGDFLYNGSTLEFTITAVPEPTVTLLLAIALAAWMLMRSGCIRFRRGILDRSLSR